VPLSAPIVQASDLRLLLLPLLLLLLPLVFCRYVKKPFDKAGTEVKLVVRGKANDAVVTKMPFVKTTYFKG
jgi:hypothetical protein